MSYMSKITAVGNANTVGDTKISLLGGGEYQIFISGTFNSATVVPYLYDDDAKKWCKAGDGVTEAKVVNVVSPGNTQFDIGVTGGDGSTSVAATPYLVRKYC